MKVRRIMETEANGDFRVGDIISFSLSDGEQAEAMAMKQEQDGMIFTLVDGLSTEYPMFEDPCNGKYGDSTLRSKLNHEILGRFPIEICNEMVPFPNGDLLRIPTEREIFGENIYGEEEPDSVEQWKPMKLRRNRIAFLGMNGEWDWYWLENKVRNSSAAGFASVSSSGFCDCNHASDRCAVRPVFKIKSKI